MPPRLETPRLSLRSFCEQDIHAAYQIFETHPDVYQYDPGYRRSLEQRAELIRKYAAENDENGVGTLAVMLRGSAQLIGYCGLQLYVLPREPFATPEVELFYKLGRDYWSRGYAFEACETVLRYAFESLRLDHTVSCVDRRNERSIRLLERLGALIEPGPEAWAGIVVGTIQNPAKG